MVLLQVKLKPLDYAKTLLENDLRPTFEKMNPHLPIGSLALCFEQVLSAISKPESLDLITNNKQIANIE